VITVRYRPGSPADLVGDLNFNTWLADRARDGFELQLSGFGPKDILIAMRDFLRETPSLYINPLWQVREISDAEWKTASARDGIVDVNGEGVPEGVPQPNILRELIYLGITKMCALLWLK